MPALSADEQDLFDFARAALPHWYFSNERANEELGEAAKVMGQALTQVRHWLEVQAFIGTAIGRTATEPDWLGQHAWDRGTFRQGSENDVTLRRRIRSIPNSVTRQNLLAEVQAMLTADGVVGAPAMVELPRDGIFLGKMVLDTGGSGEFSGPVAGVMTFEPANPFGYPPFRAPAAVGTPFTAISGRVRSHQLVITGAVDAGNNGTFLITGLTGNTVQYTNGSGVPATDSSCTWAVRRRDRENIVADGFSHSYLSRGERIGRRGGTIVVILPYGTSAATGASITEMLRQRKGAGVILAVERRQSP